MEVFDFFYVSEVRHIEQYHKQWVNDTASEYEPALHVETKEDVTDPNLFSAIIYGKNYYEVDRLSTLISTKAGLINHLENCLSKDERTNYWVFYTIRELHKMLRNKLKKMLKKFSLRDTLKNFSQKI